MADWKITILNTEKLPIQNVEPFEPRERTTSIELPCQKLSEEELSFLLSDEVAEYTTVEDVRAMGIEEDFPEVLEEVSYEHVPPDPFTEDIVVKKVVRTEGREVIPVTMPVISPSLSSVSAEEEVDLKSKITIVLRDTDNKPVSGALAWGSVDIGLTGDAYIAKEVKPVGVGTYEATIANATAETVTVSVTALGVVLDDEPEVEFLGSELPVVEGLALHLDPSDPETVETNSPRIVRIKDKGFYERDAVQLTEGSRPYVVEHNGRNWIDFSQGNHYFDIVTNPPLPDGRTIFVVAYLPYSVNPGTIRALMQQYPDWYTISFNISSGNVLENWVRDTGDRQALGSAAVDMEEIAVWISRWENGDKLEVFRNLEPAEGQVNIGTVVLGGQTGWRIGSNRNLATWFDGYMGEVIVYDRALTDLERVEVAGYLKAKWETSPPPPELPPVE